MNRLENIDLDNWYDKLLKLWEFLDNLAKNTNN